MQGDQIEIHNITMEPALQIPNPATAPNPPQPPPYQILPGNDPVPSPYTPLQFQARPNILATYEDVDDDVMAHVSVHTSSENGSDGSTVGAAEGVIYEWKSVDVGVYELENKGFHIGDAGTKNWCPCQKFVIGLDW